MLFFVFALFTFFFAFGISPKVILKVVDLFKRPEEDEELAALNANAQDNGFKMNEGVPVVRHAGNDRPEKPQPKLSTLKNSAATLSAKENHEALTTSSDPEWKFPSVTLLDQRQDKADAGNVEANAQAIKTTFQNFDIGVEMEGANIGPSVTQYTMKPPNGVKLTKITALENNLALDLAATTIRIEAPIPGKESCRHRSTKCKASDSPPELHTAITGVG